MSLALLLASSCAKKAPSAKPAVSFRTVDEGIEYAHLWSGPDAAPFGLHAFRVDLTRAGVRVLPAGGPSTKRTAQVIARALPRALSTNASFFDAEHDKTMGLVVDQGRTVSKRRLKAWHALVVNGAQAKIVKGGDIDLKAPGELVVQGHPRLVEGGKVQGLKPQSARRTAVCADGSRITLVVTTTRAEAGAFAKVLAAPEDQGGLGCKDAMNLDGGPSTQLSARLKSLELSIDGGWGVPNALVAIPGLPSAGIPPAPVEADAGPTRP
jgi:hypothetical protein